MKNSTCKKDKLSFQESFYYCYLALQNDCDEIGSDMKPMRVCVHQYDMRMIKDTERF